MKKLAFLGMFLFLVVSCKDSSITNEIKNLKSNLEKAETTIAEYKAKAGVAADFKFIHTVYFWLNEGIADDERQKFMKGLKSLGAIESVGKVIIGPPAGTPREVVDNSYDYAYIVSFKDKAAHDIYQDHPIHLAFIEECKDTWTKVQVYDNLVEK